MKKRKALTAVGASVAAIVMLAAIAAKFSGQKPFGALAPTDLVSASVLLSPPGKTVEISDLAELAGYLNDVVIYSKDNSHTGYAGQDVTFTMIMSDGTQTDVTAYHPFLVIDGVRYRTKDEPCQALNDYANRLLRDD